MEKTFQPTIFKPKKTKILVICAITFLIILLPFFLNYMAEFTNHVCNSSYCRKFLIPCPKNYASSAFEYAVSQLMPVILGVAIGTLLLGILSKLILHNFQKEWTLTADRIISGKKTINLSDITQVSHIPSKCCKKINFGFNGTILVTLDRGSLPIVLKFPPKQKEDGLKAAEFILSFFDSENYHINLDNDTTKYKITKNIKQTTVQQSKSTSDDIKLF